MKNRVKISAIMVAGLIGLGASSATLAYNPYYHHDGIRHHIIHHDRRAIRHIKNKQQRIYFKHLGRAIRADLNGRPGKANRIMRNARHKIHHLNRVKHAYHRDIRHAEHRYY